MSSRWDIRQFEEKDIDKFLSLKHRIFDHGSREWFDWKYKDNPYTENIPILTVSDPSTGKYVGFRPHLALKLEAGNRSGIGFQPCDTMVHPDYRRQGIFSQMTTEAIEKYGDEGPVLFFNFPNNQSRPGYLKLGWEIVGKMHTETRSKSAGKWAKQASSRPIEVAGIIATPLVKALYRVLDKLSTPYDSGVRISRYETAPVEKMANLSQLSSCDKLGIRKDREFYQWRFDRPDLDYEFYIASRDNKPLAGLSITKRTSEHISSTAIVDSVADPKSIDEAVWYMLLKQVIDQSDQDKIQLNQGAIPRKILRRLGFFSSSSPPLSYVQSPPQLVTYPLSDSVAGLGKQDLKDAENWDLPLIAWDVF